MRKLAFAMLLLALPTHLCAQRQQPPPAPQQTPPAPPAPAKATTTPAANPAGPKRISLDEAIRLALQHNHALLAARSTILQNQAQEITANLRPNPSLSADYNFVPAFSPSYFNIPSSQAPLPQEFDISVAYTWETAHKRQKRLAAAKDQTAATIATVTDNERTLVFNVASQFISVLLAQSTIDLAVQDVDSFQKTVDISKERFRAGDMSEGDFLKIRLQLLQFQTDLSSAQLSKVQAIAALRQLIGFESVPDQFDVEGKLEYQPIPTSLEDLRVLAMRTRPDLLAAQLNVTAAESQYRLAKANGKPDVVPSVGYSHAGGESTLDLAVSLNLPIFDRNQGEVARTNYVITQSQQLATEAAEQVSSDVVDAYETLHMNDEIIRLYEGGYVADAQKSREITEYAYRRGAASLLDFLDSERTYRANQLGYRQALAAYMTAVEQTREAVGTRNLP
jgi:outer membrane protein, heavy metal efflux system